MTNNGYVPTHLEQAVAILNVYLKLPVATQRSVLSFLSTNGQIGTTDAHALLPVKRKYIKHGSKPRWSAESRAKLSATMKARYRAKLEKVNK